MFGQRRNRHVPQRTHLARTGRHRAGRAVGGLALLPALGSLDREPQPQHVDTDWHRRRRRVRLQPGGDRGARLVPGLVSRTRAGRSLLRGRGDHRLAYAARPDVGTRGAFEHVRRAQGVTRPGAEDSPASPPGRRRGRHSAGARARRRSSARTPGRESAGGRGGARRPIARGRVDADRRAGPGREDGRERMRSVPR